MIIELDYSDILPVWQTYLWSNRQSKIETHSAMMYQSDQYDINNFKFKPTYFAFCLDDVVAGVNSGHMCTDGSYRSRGLFVFPQYRGMGIGPTLLQEAMKQGIKENAKFVWSYPRESSWAAYSKAGFTLTSEWKNDEMSRNAYCFFDCSSIKD